MPIKEQIKALRRGNTGSEILSILNNITGNREVSQSEEIAAPGYIMTWDGRQVVF